MSAKRKTKRKTRRQHGGGFLDAFIKTQMAVAAPLALNMGAR